MGKDETSSSDSSSDEEITKPTVQEGQNLYNSLLISSPLSRKSYTHTSLPLSLIEFPLLQSILLSSTHSDPFALYV